MSYAYNKFKWFLLMTICSEQDFMDKYADHVKKILNR